MRRDDSLSRNVIYMTSVILFLAPFSFLFGTDSNDSDKHAPPMPNVLYSTDLIRSGASLGYLFSDDINIIGLIQVDFPFLFKSEKSAYMNLLLTNTVSKVENDISFKVRDLDYRITIGARDYLTRKLIVSAFLSQQGVEKVDSGGSPFIRYVGFSMESEDYRDAQAERGTSWYGEIGAIFKNRDVSGEMTFKGDVRFNYLSTERLTYGLDFSIDSLINDFNTSNDWKLGPRITFCNGCSSAPSAFIYYMNNKNPLGFGDDGFFVGVDYREKAYDGSYKIILPDIEGTLSAGAGQGREESRCSLRLRTPSFGESLDLRITFDIDTFILTGDDTGNLYYFLAGGLEREWKSVLQGAYFFHRSNHQLAEPSDRINSVNIIEVGVSSKGWESKSIMDGHTIGIGTLDGRAVLNFLARAGFLINSTFGEERRWNLKGGLRIDFPIDKSGFTPFLSAFWEGGDASRKEFTAGFRTPLDIDLAFQYKKDEQYYGADDDAFLILASLFF